METYILILVVVALIAFAVYETKWKPRHQECPDCGKKNYSRYAVDTEIVSEDDMDPSDEGTHEWKVICRYYEKYLRQENPFKPVKVTTHFRCKDCGCDDVRITYSHTADYEIGTGMHNMRWGKKVYSGKEYEKADACLKSHGDRV